MIFKFNAKKIIPSGKDLDKIITLVLAGLFSYYVLSNPIEQFFPKIMTYPIYIQVVLFVALSYYIGNIFDFRLFNRELL